MKTFPSGSQIINTDGGLLPSHVYCVDWALRRQTWLPSVSFVRQIIQRGVCAIEYANGTLVALWRTAERSRRRTLVWWCFIRRRYNFLLITHAQWGNAIISCIAWRTLLVPIMGKQIMFTCCKLQWQLRVCVLFAGGGGGGWFAMKHLCLIRKDTAQRVCIWWESLRDRGGRGDDVG